MRICIDIDGTICKTRKPNQSYEELEPAEGAVEALNQLRRLGHYIILHTARHMKTCESNVGKVVAKQGKTLLSWLEKQGVEFDEIWFGKPYADVYVDDNVIVFENWDSVLKGIQQRQVELTTHRT